MDPQWWKEAGLGFGRELVLRRAPPLWSALEGAAGGQARRANRAGACALLGCCARLCAPVCMHVPAYACACLRRRGRVCEGAGVCAQMHCSLRLCLRAPLGLGRLAVGRRRSLPWPTGPSVVGLTCAPAHRYLCRLRPPGLFRKPDNGNTPPNKCTEAPNPGFLYLTLLPSS